MVGPNTVENYYSVFKRGMKGVYQHCGEKHLHRCRIRFPLFKPFWARMQWRVDARNAIEGRT
jgi:hypothetical protein